LIRYISLIILYYVHRTTFIFTHYFFAMQSLIRTTYIHTYIHTYIRTHEYSTGLVTWRAFECETETTTVALNTISNALCESHETHERLLSVRTVKRFPLMRIPTECMRACVRQREFKLSSFAYGASMWSPSPHRGPLRPHWIPETDTECNFNTPKVSSNLLMHASERLKAWRKRERAKRRKAWETEMTNPTSFVHSHAHTYILFIAVMNYVIILYI
jgi:hypothetical protein